MPNSKKAAKKFTRKNNAPALPKGYEAAGPIKNARLRKAIAEDDFQTSGGTNTLVNGKPLLGRRVVHH